MRYAGERGGHLAVAGRVTARPSAGPNSELSADNNEMSTAASLQTDKYPTPAKLVVIL